MEKILRVNCRYRRIIEIFCIAGNDVVSLDSLSYYPSKSVFEICYLAWQCIHDIGGYDISNTDKLQKLDDGLL